MSSSNITQPASFANDGSRIGVQAVQYHAHGPTIVQQAQDTLSLRAWRLTDPRDDRTRILASKDPLLAGSCDWILDDAAFAQWWRDDESRILWIHGDPGKGKTMLMMALTEEIARRVGATPDQKAATAFFFCQNTVPELSNAAAVVRGLTFLLATEQPALRRHLERKYAEAGERLFEGLNVLPSLWTTLADMAQDASVSRLYLLVDALDECEQDSLRTFLDLATSPTAPCKIKWVFTSRNEQHITQRLRTRHNMSLELNAWHVSTAVVSFIHHKTLQLAEEKDYSVTVRQKVQEYLDNNAHGTFLWVALVCKALSDEDVYEWNVIEVMEQFPAELEPLYERMLQQLRRAKIKGHVKFREDLLRVMTVACRPLTVEEVGYVAGLLDRDAGSVRMIQDLVNSCGSFLTIRENTIYFVHQSAKDYFTTGPGCIIFPNGQPQAHEELARRLLDSMWYKLTTDVCGVRWPGTQVHEAMDQVVCQRLPLHVQYACCHWADHVKAGGMTLEDGGAVHAFLKARLLMLFEALSWLGRVSDGMGAMRQLADMTEQTGKNFQMLLQDAIRFVRYSRTAIEQAPLQIYSSALVFAPEKSIVRQLFSQAIPLWIRQLPWVEQDWSACLQTLEGHSGGVTSVVFSPDGQTVASGSYDETVKLWDASTGALRSTLEGHLDVVTSVVFSPDGQTVASGSDDKTVKLWDASTGAVRSTLEGHLDVVTSVVFSPDGQTVASGSDDATVKLWDASTGAVRSTLEGHLDVVTSVVFSPDGQTVASGSYDETVKLWDASTGALRSTLEGHLDGVGSVVFSPDGQTVASGSDDKTVKLWDASTGQVLDTITAGGYITQISFSEDGSLLQTNRGAFSSAALSKSTLNTTTLSVQIAVGASWITWKGRDLLWLPPEYRTDVVAVYHSSTVLGRTSGYVTFIGFGTSVIAKPQ
ncbi:unnamed protein product [Alternaria alternata]